MTTSPSDQCGFTLTQAQWDRVRQWQAEVFPRAIRKSRHPGTKLMNGMTEPYYGAVGGGVTFTFTPTSVGMICTVREAITGEELVLDEDFG